jgi:hypothetical protein
MEEENQLKLGETHFKSDFLPIPAPALISKTISDILPTPTAV